MEGAAPANIYDGHKIRGHKVCVEEVLQFYAATSIAYTFPRQLTHRQPLTTTVMKTNKTSPLEHAELKRGWTAFSKMGNISDSMSPVVDLGGVLLLGLLLLQGVGRS